MYVRGSDKNIEYKRDLNGFFRGIIMDDADFRKLYRCKIFIPELHSGYFTNEKGEKTYIAPDIIGSMRPDVHKAFLETLPWAEQASSLFGEQGMSHYSAFKGQQTGGVNYPQASRRNTPPNSRGMGTYPAQTIGNSSATGGPIADNNPSNPTGNIYAPSPNAPSAHGIHGTPSVGAHVWVFFDRGDINCPVYFAACPSGVETNQVMQEMNVTGYSSNYGEQKVEDTPPEPKDPLGARLVSGEGVPGSDVTEFVKEFEGYNSNAYWDYGQTSIGYGTKARPGETSISQEEATRRLNFELQEARGYVDQYNTSQNRNWSPNQLDALTSFTYNTGPGNLRTLLQGGARNNQQIAAAIPLYRKAGGKTLRGLVRRRAAERQLFEEGYN